MLICCSFADLNLMSILQYDLSTEDLLIYEAEKKSIVVAYLLWLFLGGWGAHCFYLGQINKGILYVVLSFGFVLLIVVLSISTSFLHSAGSSYAGFVVTPIAVGIFVLWLVDAFTLHEKITKMNLEVLYKIKARRANT